MVNMHRAGIDNYVSENFVDNGERVLLINEKTKQGFAIAQGGMESISTDLTKKEEWCRRA